MKNLEAEPALDVPDTPAKELPLPNVTKERRHDERWRGTVRIAFVEIGRE